MLEQKVGGKTQQPTQTLTLDSWAGVGVGGAQNLKRMPRCRAQFHSLGVCTAHCLTRWTTHDRDTSTRGHPQRPHRPLSYQGMKPSD